MTTSLLASPPVALPRVRSVPEYDFTLGPEAVELSAAAGLDLDPWQALAVDDVLAESHPGRWAAFEAALLVPRQNGKGAILECVELADLFLFGASLILHTAHEFKALDVATPVLTPAGWSTMGALRTGDQVYGPDGAPTRVTAHPIREGRPCYRLTFDDGQTVVADEDHLWAVTYVSTWGKQKQRVVTTKEIVEHGVAARATRPGRDRVTYHFRVPVTRPLDLPAREQSVDPWLFGAWLGDGTSAKGELTCGAEDLPYMLEQLDALGEQYRVRPDARTPDRVFTVIIAGLATRLRTLGVLGAKSIPDCYALGSIEQRRALLAGLMDTDGGVSAHQTCLTMMNEALVGQILELVRSLGHKATMRSFAASISGRAAGIMHRVQFRATPETSPFRMPRKTAAIRHGFTGTRASYNAIVAVEAVESRPTRCITVDNVDSLYVVGRGFVPTHNTAQEAFRRILFLVDNTDALRRKVDRVRTSHGEEGIELTRAAGGGRLRFLARSGGSGRGFSADRVIYDEAYELPEETVAASLPTMSARPNPGVIYTSSAALDKSVVLRRVMARGRREDDREKDPGLCYLEHSADPKADLDDREQWRLANPAMGIRIKEEFVAKERAAMSDVTFARERLGIVDESRSATVVDMDAWDDAASPGSMAQRPVAFGIDTSPDGAFTSIAVAGRNAEGRVHVEVVDRRRGTGWVVDRVEELRDAWAPTSIVCDPIGPVGSLLPAFTVAGVEITELGLREHVQACGLFKQMVEAPLDRYAGSAAQLGVLKLAHHGQIGLRAALEAARKRNVGEAGGWLWNRRDDTDISPLVAVTLALYAHSRDVPAPSSQALVFGW